MLPLPPFVGAPEPVFAPAKQTVTLVNQSFTAATSPFVSDGSVTATITNGQLTVTSTLDWYGVVATFRDLTPGRVFFAQGVLAIDSGEALVAAYTQHWDTLNQKTVTSATPVPFVIAVLVPDDGVVVFRIAPSTAGAVVTADDLLVQLLSPMQVVTDQTFTTDALPFVPQAAAVVSHAGQNLTVSSVYQPWSGVTHSFTTKPNSRYFLRAVMRTEIPNSAFVLIKDGAQIVETLQWADSVPLEIIRGVVFTSGTASITLGTVFPGFNSVFDRFVLERLPDAP